MVKIGDDEWKARHLPASLGCLIDGHWGQYGVIRLIQIAQEYGFQVNRDDELSLAAYIAGKEDFEYESGGNTFKSSASDWILSQGGLADNAEEWLNKNVAQEGHSFGWHESEFFYMKNEWFDQD